MADIKPQVYKDPRPAEYFTRFHEHIRAHPPGWIYELVRLITTWISILLYRERAINTQNLPADGPVIVAPNHFSNMDHFFAGAYVRRKMQFMAKSQLFGNPILNYIFRIGGVFPIRRGYRDEEAFKTAHAILARGNCVLMYCEGGRSRTGQARRGQTRSRPARARVRSSGGPGGDPRLARRAQVAQAALPEGHRAIRRADHLPGCRQCDAGAAARGSRDRLRVGQGDVHRA